MTSGKSPRFPWKKEYTELLSYSTVGIEMGAAVGIGVAMGWALDVKLMKGRTFPWLTLVFFGFGIAAAGLALYRAIKEMKQRQDEADKEVGPRQE